MLPFGIDLDGIVYKWIETVHFMIEEKFGIKLVTPDHWGATEKALTKEQWQWLWTGGIKHGLFRHGTMYRGSLEALKKLSELGEIMIITSRPKEAYQDTMDWLSFHKMPVSRVAMIGPNKPKSAVLPHCCMYVDDSVRNCNDLLTTKAEVLLWDRPWSLRLGEARREEVRVVGSWEQILDVASSIASKHKDSTFLGQPEETSDAILLSTLRQGRG